MQFLAILIVSTALAALVGRRKGGWRDHSRERSRRRHGDCGRRPFRQLRTLRPAPARLGACPRGTGYITGAFEIAARCGVALLEDASRRGRQAGGCIPRRGVPGERLRRRGGRGRSGQPGGVHALIRLPLQLLFIGWALFSTGPHTVHPCAARPRPVRIGAPVGDVTIAATDARLNPKGRPHGKHALPNRICGRSAAMEDPLDLVRCRRENPRRTQRVPGGEPTNSFDIPGAESQQAVELIEDRFPGLTGTTSRIVFHTDSGRLDDPRSAAIVDASVRDTPASRTSAASPTRSRRDAATVSADGERRTPRSTTPCGSTSSPRAPRRIRSADRLRATGPPGRDRRGSR